jgi:hypothetical protein
MPIDNAVLKRFGVPILKDPFKSKLQAQLVKYFNPRIIRRHFRKLNSEPKLEAQLVTYL